MLCRSEFSSSSVRASLPRLLVRRRVEERENRAGVSNPTSGIDPRSDLETDIIGCDRLTNLRQFEQRP
jgi:hypothetical protein